MTETRDRDDSGRDRQIKEPRKRERLRDRENKRIKRQKIRFYLLSVTIVLLCHFPFIVFGGLYNVRNYVRLTLGVGRASRLCMMY